MPSRSARRDFLKRLPWVGAAIPLAGRTVQGTAPAVRPSAQLRNEFLDVGFAPDTGRLEVWRSAGGPLLSGSVVRAHTSTGPRAVGGPDYRRELETIRVRDKLGEGRQMVVRWLDGHRQLDFEVRVTLYDAREAVFIEVGCRNVSTQPIRVSSLEPVCALPEGGGSLQWPEASKLLTNGLLYSDPGRVAEFAQPGTDPVRSWWNVGFFRGYDREGLACGFVENQVALGRVVVRRDSGGTIGMIAEAVLAEGHELAPGRSAGSGRFVLQIAGDPYTALERYADLMGTLQSARVGSVLSGWCNWFYTFEHITEEEVIRNAEFAARALKPYGLEYVQVDEGFQRWHGDWEGNERFPHGMRWLANRIRKLGLKPGIWIAPYVISEPAAVFREHPEWLLRHPDGRLRRVGPWPGEDTDWARNENPKRYGLDVTHPGAAAWLERLFETVARQWGYEMIKIDFVEWSLLAAHRYHDAGATRAGAYRRGFEIMRRAVGPECHLQDCGPGPVTVGLLDSMRIELDQNYGFRGDAWKQYFLNSSSSAPAAAKRYYFHKRTWINDADHVCLNLLSLPQAQAAATLIALTGGNVLSGDRLPDLDPSRLEILRKILPSGGEAARPVDLFDTDRHTTFALPVRRRWAHWTVVGLFNPDQGAAVERVVSLARLGLDASAAYVAYDFWGERLLGEFSGELRVAVPAAAVVLLSLHRKRGVPQVVSADRHILQGALELEDVVWDAAHRTLAGISLGSAGTAHNLSVFLPEPRPWVQGGPFLHRDLPSCTLKVMEPQLLRIRVRFDRKSRVGWSVRFDDLFGTG